MFYIRQTIMCKLSATLYGRPVPRWVSRIEFG